MSCIARRRCCSRRCRDPSAFCDDGQRLGTADVQRSTVSRDARVAAAEKQYTDQPHESCKDDTLTDKVRAKIWEERLVAAEGRLTKQEKEAMRQKKKPASYEALRGPNSQNIM